MTVAEAEIKRDEISGHNSNILMSVGIEVTGDNRAAAIRQTGSQGEMSISQTKINPGSARAADAGAERDRDVRQMVAVEVSQRQRVGRTTKRDIGSLLKSAIVVADQDGD